MASLFTRFFTAIENLEPRRLMAAAPAVEAAPDPAVIPASMFHLTARSWQPLNTSPSAYLDIAEGVAKAMAKLQNAQGEIIDPYENRETGATTPYFAFGVGVLVSTGRSRDLLDAGIAAMDVSTEKFEQGVDAIDNESGEFYFAPLTQSLSLYAPYVSADKLALWTQRMSRPLQGALRGLSNNWETYAMRGDWLRAKAGLEDPAVAQSFIEDAWTQHQADRIETDRWNLYHDESSDPDTFAAEPVGRSNLLGLLADGYNGPSAAAMKLAVDNGTRSSLFLQDATGQAPGGGRTSGHVWNDSLSTVTFELAAKVAKADAKPALAGQYRHAALLALKSMQRWQRPDGSFWVTKNQFDPADRVGYSQASFFTNYNCAILQQMTSAYLTSKQAGAITEQPTPAEIGGYGLTTDPAYSAFFAGAGGVQVQGSRRGSTEIEKNQYWTTLGLNRISKSGWDSRLGSIEASHDTGVESAISFAPTFLESGDWVRLSSDPNRFDSHVNVEFVSPFLERLSVDYTPTDGHSGPSFHQALVITPDGVMSTVTTSDPLAPTDFGTTVPLLESDGGAPTAITASGGIAAAQYPGEGDQLAYLAINDAGVDAAATIDTSGDVVRGVYGDILPARMVGSTPGTSTFIYPRVGSDPAAADVAASFNRSGADFSSLLGRVTGDIYVGKTSAGGFGRTVDLNNDGTADVTFNQDCQFVIQLGNDGKVASVEVDRAVHISTRGKSLSLAAFTPRTIGTPASPAPTPTPTPSPTPTPAPTPTPTPTPTATTPITLEVESLPVKGKVPKDTLMDETTFGDDGSASGGAAAELRPRKSKGAINYLLKDVQPGRYHVTLRVYRDSDLGIIRVIMPGGKGVKPSTTEHDLYHPDGVFDVLDLGTLVVRNPKKPPVLKFRIVGRNALATANNIELDALELTPQPEETPS